MRAVAKDEQGEPDPQHFERFCHAIVLEMLTDVCHVGTELATQVGDDILARGESYAALDDAARNVLISRLPRRSPDTSRRLRRWS